MKVAHLIDSGGLYGAEQVLLTLCKHQQKQGITPLIVSCGLPNEAEKAIECAAREQAIDLIVWRMAAGINIKGMKALLVQLREQGVSLLHSHGYKFNILIGLLSFAGIDLPCISTVHGYVKAKFPKKMWVYELLDKLFLKHFNAVVLVSERMRDISAFKRNPKVHVIKNGISAENNLPASALESSPFKILAVGRLSPEKGFEYLIRAIAEINSQSPVCELVIFGGGGLRVPLESLVLELAQEKQITFSGFVADAQQYFHEYQIIVMPSLTEGIPVTLLEALRNKTPILASAVGGIPEVLGAEHDALLVPASVSDIVVKLQNWIAATTAYKRQIVDANYDCFIRGFTTENMAKQYLELYNKVVPQGRVA